MSHANANDLKRINNFLEKTQAFIDYVETTEEKMKEWREEMAHCTETQKAQLDAISGELNRMEKVLSETSLQSFRVAAEETVTQGEDYLTTLKHTEQQLLRQIHDHRAELTRITQHALTKITLKSTQALGLIDERLSQYDPNQFNQIAKKSCKEVEKSAHQVIKTGGKLLKYFEWRAITLTLITSLTTALIFGLYVNDEYPWETHQHAINERGAGKVLLDAWPSLTHHEKTKILHNRSYE